MIGIADHRLPRRAVLQWLPDKPGKGFRSLPGSQVIGRRLDGYRPRGVASFCEQNRVARRLAVPVAVETDAIEAVEGPDGPSQGDEEPLPSDDPVLPAVDDKPGPAEDEDPSDGHEDEAEENRSHRGRKPAGRRERAGAETDQEDPETRQEEGDPEEGEAPSPAFLFDDIRIASGLQ